MTEPVTIAIGLAIGKAVIKSWLKESIIISDVSGGLLDIAASSFGNHRVASSAKRHLERIAERSADSLAPFIEHEWKSLPDNEKIAASLAAANAIERANVSAELLAQIDFQPQRLFEILKAKLDARLLGERAEQLSIRCLDQSAQLIIDIADTLPDFTLDTYRDILKRESEIISSMENIFDEFEKIRAIACASTSDFSDSHFEETYRKSIGRSLDAIELFGLDVSSKMSSRHHNLTAAYISLSVTGSWLKQASKSKSKSKEDELAVSSDDVSNSDTLFNLKVEQAASAAPRVIIRGEAGSGKTTLLQSLAVRAATASFGDEMSEWNDLVPFLIRLRAIGGDEMPPPEKFASLAAPAIAGIMPVGWVHRQFEQGRALLLVDGLDEISSARREVARRWIADLLSSFPECRVIITSRPVVIADNWLSSQEFVELELLPMAPHDVSAFISHWHQAVSLQETDAARRAEIFALIPPLQERIRTDRSLRELGATPLLCAMLCAMNRERHQVLPSNRIALYEAAVSMIAHGRDVQRKIRITDIADIDYDTKIGLLQEIAFWMMENGWSMADRWRLNDYLLGIIPKYSRIAPSISADSVTDSLVQRSGILRSPIDGKIDFIHNAFKEYLAAKAVAQGDRFGYLERSLSKEAWREVATLAPAMTDERRRSEFVSKLLHLGDQNERRRSMYHLLAVRCLETCTALTPELQEQIKSRISELRPPRNMSEAKALSGAGDLGLPLLRNKSGAHARPSAACVRTLRYIGTPAALDTLESYSSDARSTVAKELLAAWSFFDRNEYARRILAKSPIAADGLHINSLSMVPGIKHLSSLKTLEVRCEGLGLDEAFYRELSDLRNLRNIRVWDCEELDLSRFKQVQNFKSVIVRSNNIIGMESIGSSSSLMDIFLTVREAINLPVFSGSSGIRRLRVSARDLSGAEYIKNIPELKVLYLRGVSDFSLGANDPAGVNLEMLGIHAISPRTMERLASLPKLTTFEIFDASNITNIREIGELESLRSLTLRNASQLSSLAGLEYLPHLHTLQIFGASDLIDVSPLRALTNLRSLTFTGSDAVRGLDVLGELPNLRRVMAPLNICSSLRELGLSRLLSYWSPGRFKRAM